MSETHSNDETLFLDIVAFLVDLTEPSHHQPPLPGLASPQGTACPRSLDPLYSNYYMKLVKDLTDSNTRVVPDIRPFYIRYPAGYPVSFAGKNSFDK